MIFSLACYSNTFAASMPACPSHNTEAYPPYAGANSPPSVATWRGLKRLAPECRTTLQGAAELTVAFASLFTIAGPIDDIAERLGAVSATKGLKYWSVTDQDWRLLISDAYAIESENGSVRRADFTDKELLSGETLYFAQNDTRTWGLNKYSLQVVSSSANHMVVVSQNISSLSIGPIKLFEPGATNTVVFINRLDANTWRYFNLTTIKNSRLPVQEKSVINRQAAFYRLLIGKVPDGTAALAP